MDHGKTAPQKVEAPFKVVGFHVEGASPSPRLDGLSDVVTKTGSMSPVIIPPSFQGGDRRSTPDVSPKRGAPSTSSATFEIPAPVRTSGSRRTSTDSTRSPSSASAQAAAAAAQSHAGGPLPLTPVASGSAPASLFQEAAAQASSPKNSNSQQQQQPQQQQQQQKKAQPQAQQQVAQAKTTEQPQARPQQKELSRAERRAIQEAQRAAKAAAKSGSQQDVTKLEKTSSSSSLSRQTADMADGKQQTQQQQQPSTRQQRTSSSAVASAGPVAASGPPSKATALFAHLPQFKAVSVETVAERAAPAGVPVECVRLGLEMAEGRIRGTNARCAAMLDMFSDVFRTFKAPPGKVFSRECSAALNAMVSFLVSCRPLSPAMGNAVKAVKAELGRIGADPSISDSDAKAQLLAHIATFVQEKVRFARSALAREAAAKIQDGDVVLTYAHSSTVEAVLYAAAAEGKRFSVVVVDARPLLEGRELLRRLLSAGIPCDYVLLNGLDIGMSQATKVVLGAAAVMSNGVVLSRVGAAAVAMAAAAAHVPVMVCAETYKFHERVQLDCITYNELGDPEGLLAGAGGGAAALRDEWATNDNLSLLNLMYDAMPGEFVTAIVTEVGALPPTSVPVVLREYRLMTSEMSLMMT